MLPKKTFALVHVRISFKTFLHVRATLDVDISVFPCHCPTLNNEIMNYRGSSDVSWTGLGLEVKQEREAWGGILGPGRRLQRTRLWSQTRQRKSKLAWIRFDWQAISYSTLGPAPVESRQHNHWRFFYLDVS